MCTNQDMSNIPFIMRENHFLVHRHKKDLPHIIWIFHLLKYVVKMCLLSAILHHIYLLRLSRKSYFKISTFQPSFNALQMALGATSRYITSVALVSCKLYHFHVSCSHDTCVLVHLKASLLCYWTIL